MLHRAYLGLAVFACLTFSGCSGAKQDYKYRIVVIPKGTTHDFWQSIHRGAERAALDLREQKNLLVDVRWDGPIKENDTQAQISIIDRNVAAHISGIVLAPQHSEAMIAPVERAVRENIPVIIIDSGLAPEGMKLAVKYIATDNYNGGLLAGKHLIKVLRDAGKSAPNIVLFRYQVGSESTDQREKGFVDYVNSVIEEQKKAGQPTITWLSMDKYAGPTLDSAQKEAMPLLNNLRDKGIDGIFAPNETSATGMMNALRSLHLNKNVRLVGFDSGGPLVDGLHEGDVEAVILQDPYRMGYLGVWTLVHHLEGYDVAADGKKILSTGENVVTSKTIDAQSTRELFDADLQAQRKIETPAFPKK